MFTPARRHAVLINGKDLDKMGQGNHIEAANFRARVLSLPPALAPRGVKRLFSLSTIFSGVIPDFSEGRHPQHPLFPNAMQDEYRWELTQTLANRADILCKSVLSVYPDEDIFSGYENAARELAASVQDADLTYIYVYSHGTTQGLSLGRTDDVSFESFMEPLDHIPGKKIIVLTSCYSGRFISLLANRSNQNDYSLIASTGDEEGHSWLDDRFHDEVFKALFARRKLSELAFDRLESTGLHQTPHIFLGFDAVF